MKTIRAELQEVEQKLVDIKNRICLEGRSGDMQVRNMVMAEHYTGLVIKQRGCME